MLWLQFVLAYIQLIWTVFLMGHFHSDCAYSEMFGVPDIKFKA